ncbi:hypothetical protein M0R45_008489 [Rubus argutus]|uniref:Retrotransposon gag domain-containing protein n=1 Tax=Rubus argutus TaxID=59490 RepID=A0AAW1Y0X3_RUBAR
MMARLETMIRNLQESNEQLHRDQLAAQEASSREINLLKEQLSRDRVSSPSASTRIGTETPVRSGHPRTNRRINTGLPADQSRQEHPTFRVSFLDADGVVHPADDDTTEVQDPPPLSSLPGGDRGRFPGHSLQGIKRPTQKSGEPSSSKSAPSLGMAKQPIGPFTKRIHGHNRDFKNLKMDSYTGKEDPDDACDRLPVSLVEVFTAEYATKSSFFYSVGELTGFQQNRYERLADYMERFKAAYRRCTAEDDVRAAQIFRDGLEPVEFLRKTHSSGRCLDLYRAHEPGRPVRPELLPDLREKVPTQRHAQGRHGVRARAGHCR